MKKKTTKNKSVKKSVILLSAQEIKEDKYSIGYVSSDFKSRFGSEEFSEKSVGMFKILQRNMTDAEIENELKPGICTVADIAAFLKNLPEGTKNGNWNLFYTSACVVSVRWNSYSADWNVNTWSRGGLSWDADGRVFSPATDRSYTVISSETLSLSDIEIRVKGKVYKLIE